MKTLILTNNRGLGSTVRILQSWLLIGQKRNWIGYVVIPPGSDFGGWLNANGIPHIESPMPWPNKRRPFPSVYAAFRLAHWARRHGVQIIHCNEHDVYPFVTVLRWFLRRPTVCHVRYLLPRDFARWTFRSSRRPDALLWTSHQQRHDSAEGVQGLVPDNRQHVVRLGFDLSAFGNRHKERAAARAAWGFQPEEIVLGQCTALRPRKRIKDFVDLVARLAAEDPRVVGVLAGDAQPGDEQYRDEVLTHIAAAGLGRRFQWLGNVNDVEPFYQGIDVFVSTSEYETFGNSVCEAMSCSRPVVAYEAGSVKEVVGDAGLIVDTSDLEALVRAARECVKNSALRESLGTTGRTRVANEFNPADSLEQLKEIYAALMDSRTR